ncbi:MAG: NUDIX domain-containing protein [Acidobacteriota bacterium]
MVRSSFVRDDRRQAHDRRRQARTARGRMTTPVVPADGQSQPRVRPPTHAGGVVVRRDGPALRYLVVTAKTESRAWVLPKGRIEEGESPSQAAHREVLEEAGVDATVRDPLDVIDFIGRKGPVRAQYFLMEFVSDGVPCEDRRQAWLELADALEALPYPGAQELVLKADALAKK